MTVTEPATTERTWRLVTAGDVELVTHRGQTVNGYRRLRGHVAALARAGHVDPLLLGTVVCTVQDPSPRWRDSDWTPTAMAAADGLLDAGVFGRGQDMIGPELRGAQGRPGTAPRLIVRVYAAGQPVPPRLGRHLAGRFEDYDDIGGDDMPAEEAASRLRVTVRTIYRWRVFRLGLGVL